MGNAGAGSLNGGDQLVEQSHPAPIIASQVSAGSNEMRLLVLSPNEINLRGLESVLSDKYADAHIETYSSAD